MIMKTTLVMLLVSFLLASAAISHAQSDPVLDTAGNSLRSGVKYYILPAIRGQGGGLTLAISGNQSCPVEVVQELNEVYNGLPVTFSPVTPNTKVIQQLADHNIKFSGSTICVQSTVWRLDSVNDRLIVRSGGVVGNPGAQTLSNWFRIEKLDNDYKFVFCPGVCSFCRPFCGNIGMEILKSGKRSLVLTDVPFKVIFKRA